MHLYMFFFFYVCVCTFYKRVFGRFSDSGRFKMSEYLVCRVLFFHFIFHFIFVFLNIELKKKTFPICYEAALHFIKEKEKEKIDVRK